MRKSLIVLAVIATICLLAISLPAFASYKKAIMEPWIGATKDELTAKWGYPQTADDLVKIDKDTVVFSYRSRNFSYPVGYLSCIVSFTLKNDVVIAYKYLGGNCPKIKRHKKGSRKYRW